VTIQLQKVDGSGWDMVVEDQPLSETNGAIYLEDTVWVSGVLDGQVTLATPAGVDVNVIDDLTYSYPENRLAIFDDDFDPTGAAFDDKLGLISGGDIVITKDWDTGWSDLFLSASVAAPNGRFRNESYRQRPQKTLHLYGGVVQDTRGPVGTVSGRGFLKDYRYDTRLRRSPPPHLPAIGYEFSRWNVVL